MAQKLFKVGVGLADDSISYLSGAGAPSGTLATDAGVGSTWANITNGDQYIKLTAGWTLQTTVNSVHDATTKATPVDADEFGYQDSAATWVLKKLTWANIKSTLKTYFDSLYVAFSIIKWVVKTTTYTAVSGDRIAADTSGGAFTITLPLSPVSGDFVEFCDAKGTWATNALTIDPNGGTIDGTGADENMSCHTNYDSFGLVYNGTNWGFF